MKTESAAGRKTDRFESAARRFEDRLDTQLELLTDAMRGSVTRADAVDGDDEYGHRRNSHIGEAVKIGAVSAQMVTALGRLSGEFNHNITVNRGAEKTVRNKRSAPEDDNYYELPRSSSHPPLDRMLKAEYAAYDAELAAQAAAATSGETPVLDKMEGVPPDENPGSNG